MENVNPRDICSNFNLEFFPKRSIIFKINEPGDKFYIILKGDIYVFMPEENAVGRFLRRSSMS